MSVASIFSFNDACSRQDAAPAAGHPTARDLFAALCIDQRGTIICGWGLTEPELLAHFDGGDVAYFEMEQQPDGSWVVLRLLEDQEW